MATNGSEDMLQRLYEEAVQKGWVLVKDSRPESALFADIADDEYEIWLDMDRRTVWIEVWTETVEGGLGFDSEDIVGRLPTPATAPDIVHPY